MKSDRFITNLIERIKKISGCWIDSPKGLPLLKDGHQLPEDLQKFYELCGGMDLFTESPFPTKIVSPQQFLLANPVIFDDLSTDELDEMKRHSSWFWYIVASHSDSDTELITIDMYNKRLGQCYNSSWILHPANSYIIASSFSDLLEQIVEVKGEKLFWDDENYPRNYPALDI